MTYLNCPFCGRSTEVSIEDPLDKYVCSNCGAKWQEMIVMNAITKIFSFPRINKKKKRKVNTMGLYGLFDNKILIEHGSLYQVAYEMYSRQQRGEGKNLKIFRIDIVQIEEIPKEVYDEYMDFLHSNLED